MKSKAYLAAEKAVGTNENRLTTGLEKMTTAELIKAYPEGVTLTGFDVIAWQDTSFVLCTFAENKEKCFGGGMVMQQLIEGILEDFDGDIEAANEDLRTYPFKVKLYWTKSKAGRKYAGVKVLPFELDKPINPDEETVFD